METGPFLSPWGSCWPPSLERDWRQPSWKEALGKGSHNRLPLLPMQEGWAGLGGGSEEGGSRKAGSGDGGGSEQRKHSISHTKHEHFSVLLEPKVNQLGFSHCPRKGKKWRDKSLEYPSSPLASPEKRHLLSQRRTVCSPPPTAPPLVRRRKYSLELLSPVPGIGPR